MHLCTCWHCAEEPQTAVPHAPYTDSRGYTPSEVDSASKDLNWALEVLLWPLIWQ